MLACGTPPQITAMATELAKAGPQCLTTFFANLRAAHLAPVLETEPAVPVYDTVSPAVWESLRLCGVDTARVKDWGNLFNEEIA